MRKNRLKKKRRGLELSPWQIEHLLTGRDTWGLAIVGEDAQRAAWLEAREELLPRWIEARPGTRPYAWWKFEASKPRRRIDGKPAVGPLHFGKNESAHDAEYESETEYLKRLYLLSEFETEFLRFNPPAESQDVLGGLAPSCGRGVLARPRIGISNPAEA